MAFSSDQIYELLTNEEDARVCKDISDDACKEVPGSFLLILVSQFFTKVADALSSSKIVLPWLLSSVGAPAFHAGLLVPIRESGSLLPQLLIGGFVRQHAVRKGFFVIGSILQGVCVAGMGLAAYYFDALAAANCIVVLLALLALSRGLCSVASKDVLGKTIPKRRRGTLSGYGASLAGLVTIAVGTALMVDSGGGDVGIFLLLAGAMCCWLVAAVVYGNITEYPGATDGGGSAFKEALASLGILKTDKEFRLFLTVRCLLMSTGLALPFFVVLARQAQPDAALSGLGLFIAVSGFASLVSGVIWGRLADRSSRQVLLVTAFASALLCLTAAVFSLIRIPALDLALIALFFLLSIVNQGVRLGRKTYVVDLAGGNKRTTYVAVGNSLIGVLLLGFGLLAAVLANFSLPAVLIFFALAGFSGALLALKLPETT